MHKAHQSLRDLYKSHLGKLSDKWSIYLDEYDEKFSKYRNDPVSLLEIGIQNGGSLEIYDAYFQNAKIILGCDIHENCKNLQYDSDRVKVIVGDANSAPAISGIQAYAQYDIIIDDGSHTSSDIVNSFCNFFPMLNMGGIYIIEDLHCSYWDGFEGGLFHPISSMNFLKKLADVINYEHWGLPIDSKGLLQNFAVHFGANLNNLPLDSIHSIEFVNSLCFIKKLPIDSNVCGPRIISGLRADVTPPSPEAYGQKISAPLQEANIWSNRSLLPENELAACQHEIDDLRKKLNSMTKSGG